MAKARLPIALRQRVIARASGCCEYCQSQARFSSDPFSIEHIIPRSHGGTDALSNLALACQGCNSRKYTAEEGLDPATGQMVVLYHPRQAPWTDHFTWTVDHTQIIGITPSGRATVELLSLNRSGLVNLRSILIQAGEHPPNQLK